MKDVKRTCWLRSTWSRVANASPQNELYDHLYLATVLGHGLLCRFHHESENDAVQEYQQARVLLQPQHGLCLSELLRKTTAYGMNFSSVSQTNEFQYLAQSYDMSPGYVDGVIFALDKIYDCRRGQRTGKDGYRAGKSERYRHTQGNINSLRNRTEELKTVGLSRRES